MAYTGLVKLVGCRAQIIIRNHSVFSFLNWSSKTDVSLVIMLLNITLLLSFLLILFNVLLLVTSTSPKIKEDFCFRVGQ